MRWLLFLVLALCSVVVPAQQITIAAAADLQFALKDIAHRYEAKTGEHVTMTFGSSGNLFTAIQNGAPYDLFFSADTDYAKKLASAGMGIPDTVYEYAIGRLVLWAPKSSPLNVQKGMVLLTAPQVRKIAIANPRHAPYGRAAEQAMKSAGVYDQVQSKLVLGENISQTAQFVESGNADVGLLSLSLVIPQPGRAAAVQGKYWMIPEKLYEPVAQAAVVIKGAHERAARHFLDFVKSAEGRAVLKSFGFGLPVS